MKTEDIKRMAQAWLQVQEASKKKLDPVGKADADIDNDGDVDKSDKYLHNRRKAVSAAIKGKGKGKEVEVQTSESVHKEEVEQIDELSKKTLGSYVAKASSAAASDAAKYGQQGSSEKGLSHFSKAYSRLHNIKKAVDKLTKEEVEQIDELSKKTLGSYVKKADKQQNPDLNKVRAARDSGGFKAAEKEMGDQTRKAKNRTKGVYQAIQKYSMKNEEVEELDELKKSTLSSYIKKASGNMAGNTAVAAAQASSSMKKSSPEVKRNIANRMKGIGRAADKLTKEETDLGEAATASHSGRPGVASPPGEGLDPAGKRELARKTPMPDFANEPKMDKKSYDAIRKSGPTAPYKAPGDKNIINKPLDITARASKKEDDGFKDA